MNEYYFRSIHIRWRNCLKNSKTKVTIVSPYLTPDIANELIELIPPERISIFTRFSLEDFASGSSSLDLIKQLLNKNYNFFEITNLHAKIIIISDYFASIGSQNLTNKGKENKEATFLTKNKEQVNEIEEQLSKWIISAKPISIEMVELFENKLPAIEKIYSQFQKILTEAQEEIKTELTFQEFIKAGIELTQKKKTACIEARQKIKGLLSNGKVPERMAKDFIACSSWWLNHSRAKRHVQAPGNAKNVKLIDGYWEIKVQNNSNSFLVEKAILRGIEIIKQYLESIENDQPIEPRELVKKIRLSIRLSVKTGWGIEYKEPFKLEGNDMKFGNQSIDIRDFTREILSFLPEILRNEAVDINENMDG